MVSVTSSFDLRDIVKAKKYMDETAPKILAQTISEILTHSYNAVGMDMMRQADRGNINMVAKVVESFTTEETMKTEAVGASVIFGSAPVRAGGVKGSRGGKIAQYLNDGVPAFNYPFKAKKVSQPREGWINTDKSPTHKGFPAMNWLENVKSDAVPKIREAIIEALDEAWGA
jgi:hypothetical protein